MSMMTGATLITKGLKTINAKSIQFTLLGVGMNGALFIFNVDHNQNPWWHFTYPLHIKILTLKPHIKKSNLKKNPYTYILIYIWIVLVTEEIGGGG